MDVLTYTPPWFRRFYSWSYLWLVRRVPWIWSLSYALLDRPVVFRVLQPLRRRWNLLLARRFVRQLQMDPPHLVIGTHFLSVDVCSAGKRAGWLHAPLVVVVTDWHPHRFWIVPEAEAFVVASEEAVAVCRQRGLPSERLHAMGIPIAERPTASADPRLARERVGLKPDLRTVLVTSGGTTVGPFERVVAALMGLDVLYPGALQLLVVCGEDQAAVRRLERRAQRATMPVAVFGWITTMPDAIAAADLMVAKAGGMTTAEALAQGVPLILYHAIPGQERHNARYISRRGAAVLAARPAEVVRALRRCLDDPARLELMRQAAARLGRPHAAAAIVSQVVEPLLKQAWGDTRSISDSK